jgi:hypothetical protein
MKKTFFIMGMAVSLVIVLLGLLVITGAITDKPSFASDAPYSYSSGYASFGGDAYTYMSNNAQEAASAARTVASNQRDIFELIQTVSGILLMGFGLLGFCHFAILKSSAEAALAAAAAPAAPAPVAEAPAPEELPDV